MQKREMTVQNWFQLWLTGKGPELSRIFSENAVYMESWGPEYHGVKAIEHWFAEWNTRGRVLAWDIKQYFHQGDQTVVEWYFQCEMNGQGVQAFDGLSLIRWSEDGRITFLKEFGCNLDRYDPYAWGAGPRFKEEAARWF